MMKNFTPFISLFILLTLNILYSVKWQEMPLDLDCPAIEIDLNDPLFENGSLTTESGGVIKAPKMRMQARSVQLDHYDKECSTAYRVCASGDLMLEYDTFLFTGKYLEYDFQNRKGYILCGRTGRPPWFFGADRIDLLPNDLYLFHKAFITASSARCPEWALSMEHALLNRCLDLDACHLRFVVGRVPLFWIPRFRSNVYDLLDSPFKYRVRWSGERGLRFSVIYRWIDWERFKTFLRFDYRLSRGPGFGLETLFRRPDCCELFCTRNYVARDSSILDPGMRLRYRLQGSYHRSWCEGQTWVRASYDKISDQEMPTDYSDRGLELRTAGKTEFQAHTQNNYLILEGTTRVRLNDFETVNELLPEFSLRIRPLQICGTGIMTQNYLSFGYYEQKYGDNVQGSSDYNSTRARFNHLLYTTRNLSFLTFSADAGFVANYYGSSPDQDDTWLSVFHYRLQMHAHLSRWYGSCKHGLFPYLSYHGITQPSIDPEHVFIFDIGDGWYELNELRFGLRNLLIQSECTSQIRRLLSGDIYAYAFFSGRSFSEMIPWIFTEAAIHPKRNLTYTVLASWSFMQGNLEQLNIRQDWTLSRNFALAIEYRQRSRFAWRKVDYCNYILNSFHSVEELLNSDLSDPRKTLLLHGYWNLSYDWAFEFKLRNGWGRRDRPSYIEYQIDIKKTVRSTWHLRLSYQHQEDEHRIALYVNIGLARPRQQCACPLPSCYGW